MSVLRERYHFPLPQSQRSRWKAGVHFELQYWDDYLQSRGARSSDTFAERLDPNLPLQPRPAELLACAPPEASILDVGAGPLTYLGKVQPGRLIHITAVDALGTEYAHLLRRYGISPLVPTRTLAAESLTTALQTNSYDLVFARNCIDHSYDPERAILEMVAVAKPGAYVLMEHHPNEAETEGYGGLHQWNFSSSPAGHFLVSTKAHTLDMTEKYAPRCDIACELITAATDGPWLITRIRKK